MQKKDKEKLLCQRDEQVPGAVSSRALPQGPPTRWVSLLGCAGCWTHGVPPETVLLC